MNRPNHAASLPSPIPDDLRAFLAKRPIVCGESRKLYDTLLKRMAAEAKPKDTIDWIYLKDTVDLTWEIQRLRILQTVITQDAMQQNLVEILRGDGTVKIVVGTPPANEPVVNYYRLVRRYFAGDPNAKREITAILSERGIKLDVASLMTLVLRREISTLEKIFEMTAGLEDRRERALREIDRRRQSFGLRARQAIEKENQGAGADIDIVEEPENTARQLTSSGEK